MADFGLHSKNRWLAVMVFGLFLANAATAQATGSPSTFTWENYRGASQWSVARFEDDTACGDTAPIYSTSQATIQHDFAARLKQRPATPAGQRNDERNTLHVAGRTLPDGDGTVKIYDLTSVFSPDCMSFGGKYRWDYSDQYQSCSGTTTLSGTRTDANGCPGPLPVQTGTITATDAAATKEQIQSDLNSANGDLQNVREPLQTGAGIQRLGRPIG